MTYFKDHDLRFGHPALGNYPPQGTCRGLFSDCPISACVFSFYLKKIKGLEVVHTAGCVACVRGSANGHTALVSRPRQCVKVPRCSPQLPPLPAFSVTHHLPRHTALQACRPQQWLDACSVLKPPQERNVLHGWSFWKGRMFQGRSNRCVHRTSAAGLPRGNGGWVPA